MSNRCSVLVRDSAGAAWPCCRTGTPRRPANESVAVGPAPGPSGPSATGPAGRVPGSARYCSAWSTSIQGETRTKPQMNKRTIRQN